MVMMIPAICVPAAFVGSLVGTFVAGPSGLLVGGVLGGSLAAIFMKWLELHRAFLGH